MMSPDEIAAAMDRGAAMASDYIRNGFVKVTLPASDQNDRSEDGLEHFDSSSIPDPDIDVPAFLRRGPDNRAPWMDREAAE